MPTYYLAKDQNHIFCPLTSRKNIGKIIIGFAEEAVNENHNFYMTSFDAKSLSVTLPLEETITNSANDLFSNIFYICKLTIKYLHYLPIY